MKHHIFILFVLVYFCSVLPVYSCTCLSFPKTFCSLTDDNHVFFTGKILRHYEKIGADDFPRYTFMDVMVMEEIHGENVESIITVLGMDGTSCGIDLTSYRAESIWLFKLKEKESISVELEHPLYRMSPCNINTLPIEGGVITGLIAPNINEMNVSAFKENLNQCLFVIDSEDAGAGITFNVRPTLVKNRVEVTKGITHLNVKNKPTQVQILSANGKIVEKQEVSAEISNFEIDMSFYPKGIYFLFFYTGETIFSKKVVKI